MGTIQFLASGFRGRIINKEGEYVFVANVHLMASCSKTRHFNPEFIALVLRPSLEPLLIFHNDYQSLRPSKTLSMLTTPCVTLYEIWS